MPRAVGNSAEVKRILELPRRKADAQDKELTELMTQHLKTPNGTMTLFDTQARSLGEIYEKGGFVGQIPVGGGKTLICFLAPTILQAKRPLLLVPARLRKKTEHELAQYGAHFRIAPFKILNYEKLQTVNGQVEFEQYCPDFIVADECHRIKNLRSARGRRLKRHFKENPDAKLVAVSGTTIKKSVMDYWHTMSWSLKNNSPLPQGWREAKDWSLAIDEELAFGDYRLAPGALTKFLDKPAPDNKKDLLLAIRAGYRNRLSETPGVIISNENYEGSSLFIKGIVHKQPPNIIKALHELRTTWCSPNGEEICEAPKLWSQIRQTASGFYYRWKEPAPKPWLEARREWAKFVRKVIKENHRRIDSEKQVAMAVIKGQYPDELYRTWLSLKDEFEPNVEAIWLSTELLEKATKWLHKDKGIVWVEHIEFGQKLSEMSGFPYYGGDSKLNILEASGPIICSASPTAIEGLNLQAWDKNLIISCPSTSDHFEQLIGRTHRTGQKSDEVTVEIIMGCIEHLDSFNAATKQAQALEASHGLRQKILYADLEIPCKKDLQK